MHDTNDRPDQATDDERGSAERDSAGQLGLGNARPGAGADWTPNPASSTTRPTTDPGDWGNRSGSGSGGQGESDMDEGDGSGSGTTGSDA